MPVRIPVPVISFSAFAVLLGVGLGMSLSGSGEPPAAEPGGQGVGTTARPVSPQNGGDGPPMDYQAVESSAVRASKSTTSAPKSTSQTAETAPAPAPRTPERTSPPDVIVFSSGPVLPTLPSVPQQPTTSSSTPSPQPSTVGE